MKIIEKISEMIEDEVEGACHYGKYAVKYKTDYPALAKVFYDIAMVELTHVDLLHDQVVKMIEEYRRTNGNPPKEMQFVYDYLHEKQIEKVNKAKNYLTNYRS